MAFYVNDPIIGELPLNQVDAGFIPPNNFNTGSTTTVPTLPLKPGMIVKGTDPTYGGGEFILLKGVTATAVGSVVTYNTTDFTTTLATSTKKTPAPMAVAMSANTSSSEWGWYQISGVAVAAKSAVATTAGASIGITTAGYVGTASTGSQVVQNAQYAATTTAGETSVAITIDRPALKDVLL